ncbi:hypothetical protein GJ744_004364 [Endocarpon pusillum]|uniref:dolichol kinase n=1 Tax=Endocarpon pusillum TaxID=364733 RepID=A0A8H7AV08_9EURO|nr:hypothetical protein GJ744_004364 [Endocarpon pusillum]
MADLHACEDGSFTKSTPHHVAGQERNCSRSPHPYHRRGTSLLVQNGDIGHPPRSDRSSELLSGISSSESGTEADDERGRFLKGLPAPVLMSHKGLRDTPFEDSTAQPTPSATPPAVENNARKLVSQVRSKHYTWVVDEGTTEKIIREKYTKRRRSEVVRRTTETVLFFAVGLVASYGHLSEDALLACGSAIACQFALVTSLYLLYPVRAAYQARQAGHSVHSSISRAFHIPSRFDPAPLLYPVFLPLVVSISLISASRSFVLPNLVLGISSLSPRAIPIAIYPAGLDTFHWLLTMVPLMFVNVSVQPSIENMTLLYPLHVCTNRTIEFLTTTSLDPTERHLLVAALVDLYLFAESAQSEILKALLWLGPVLLFVTCLKPLQWELALARIPSWRLRKNNPRPRSSKSLLHTLDRTVYGQFVRLVARDKSRQSIDSDDDGDIKPTAKKGKAAPKLSITTNGLLKHPMTGFIDHISASALQEDEQSRRSESVDDSLIDHEFTPQRRHTMPACGTTSVQKYRTTPSGRPKRSVTIGSQSFLTLTPAQAAARKWAYAVFVYAAVLFIVLGPIRTYVSFFALEGYEPFGWALGYLFGNNSQFRFWVSSRCLDTWIRLPDLSSHHSPAPMGWMERLRQNTLGPANMRVILCVYCVLVLVAGMATVLELSSIAEVDTRRKVFHGVMVVMLLPTVFIDPCFIALALILILAIFLLLDLFRASQLPPISKPLTAFLAPYVDGRDYRGPVIVSHIFLLIGCAIPLWLSLAAVGRSGEHPWRGWDVSARDVSMISGIVCVGMGDAAASLIGRRYGRHKWYWGGGKSLEGSLAFAAAVTVGLVTAYTWLRVGGWVIYDWRPSVLVLGKACLAAMGASLTEAVLTGANDNVVVPVVLWLLVRGLRL